MAKEENGINKMEITVADIKKVSGALGGLKKTLTDLHAEISNVFRGSTVAEYLKEATRSGGELDKELLLLRLNFDKFKAAVADAAAPIGAVFLPMINQAVLAATRLVRAVGQVVGALFGGSQASQELGENTENAAQAQSALAKSTAKAKRSLAGFDEINRLNATNGGSSASGQIDSAGGGNNTLSPQLQAVVGTIQSLVEPLGQIDLTPAIIAFERLRMALEPIQQTLFAGLEWAWHNLLVPLAAWSIEHLLPAFLDALSGALLALNSVIAALQPMANWLWENFLEPVAQWTGELVIQALKTLAEKLTVLSIWISENRGLVQGLLVLVGALTAAWLCANDALSGWNLLGGTAGSVIKTLAGVFALLTSPIGMMVTAITALIAVVGLLASNWSTVQAKAQAAWANIRAVWGNASQWVFENICVPLENGAIDLINGIIGFLNTMLSGVVQGINAVVNGLNALSYTVPDWVPVLGGKTLGFYLKTVTAPRIPYLAQGAVLPANKPFLAMVGDQRHGTNVEAPLETIQQAVAMVMGDQTAALLSGFEASIGVQKEILQAVLGIQIGDDVIGQAVSRYQRKMAVLKGG